MPLRPIALVAALAAGLAIPAAADAAYTTGSVNVRAGPGTGYAVIATAPPGAFVDIHKCGGSWCKVTYRRVVGWMSAGYIARGKPYYAPPRYVYRPPPPPPVYYYPRAYYPYPYPYAYPRYYRPGPSYGFWFGFRG